jgi:hypothetical protein
MSKLLEILDVLRLAGSQVEEWKTEEIMLAGCRGSKYVMKRINPNSSNFLYILASYIHRL